ncbi:helix-turn-helix transcriptional regulator [Pseudomonas sp. CM25]|uniref:helix-turn-helix transcriptional regulator n=1 Tax=unclassified Pseudomonas TaxID=196821 RepID=UPI001558063D|nr:MULTISPECIES: helix-turn-helix transcriptional regulator [unclassified Pseudomonas]NQD54152.1 helix-turn-helix transcriptional regulator [Pseudomonas sp. CM25]NQD77846.1 helix-turn-helix transcriptional regulator [Pseudomonas sp. CM27]
MEFWPLRPSTSDFRLSVEQTASLLSRTSESHGKLLAADMLKLLGAQVPLAQCTLFAYSPNRSPQIISFADRARMLELPRISSNYAERFYSMDGNQQAMTARPTPSSAERIMVQRQGIEDIAHRDYRRICYELPQISERVALLSHCDGNRWLSINFYRGREHGRFSANEINVIETAAPLIVQISRLHYRAYLEANEMPALLSERVISLYPELTRRDHELLQLMLAGCDVQAISTSMGIQQSSAATYIKRLYRKLGIAGQRELLALATQRKWSSPVH